MEDLISELGTIDTGITIGKIINKYLVEQKILKK